MLALTVADLRMHAWPSFLLILAVAKGTSAGDPLRELGQFIFCEGKPNGTLCDAGGGSICMGGKCRSVCSALDSATEKHSQCACPGSNSTAQGCELCCMSYKKACTKASVLLPENTAYTKRSQSFCYNVCPWDASGKPCKLGASATEGMCHRGRCRDPCSILSGNLVQCSGSGSCAIMGASFCCMEKDAGPSKCRVEDDWHFKLKKRIQKNSPADVARPAAALLLFLSLAAL